MVPSTLILLPIDYVLQNMKDEPEVIRVYQEQIVKWGMIYQSRAVSLSQGTRPSGSNGSARSIPAW